MAVDLDKSTGWKGTTFTLEASSGTKQALDDTITVLEAVPPLVEVAQVGVQVAKLLVPLYVDPAAAAYTTLIQGLELLLNTSGASARLIVLSDPPELGVAVMEGRFSSPVAQLKADFDSRVASLNAAADRTASFATANRTNATWRRTINAIAEAATTPSHPIDTIREQLLQSILDLGDINAPGSEGQSSAAGISLVSYGDAAAVDALAAFAAALRDLINFLTSPFPADSDLPRPSNVKAYYLSATAVQLTWTNAEPDLGYPLTLNEIIYPKQPKIYVERSVDLESWQPFPVNKVPSDFFSNTFTVDLAATPTVSAPNSFYRVRYDFLDAANKSLGSTYSPLAVCRTASQRAVRGNPPDWRSISVPGAGAFVPQTALQELRRVSAELQAEASAETQAINRVLLKTEKILARLKTGSEKVLALVKRVRTALDNLASVTVAARAFHVGGTEAVNLFDVDKINVEKTIKASAQGVLREKLYSEYTSSLAKLPRSASASNVGLGVFIVVDSAAADGVLKVIAALLGAPDLLEQYAGFLESSAATVDAAFDAAQVAVDKITSAPSDTLPPTVTVTPPNPNVDLGAASSSLNADLVASSTGRVMVGEGDRPDSGLCPPSAP